MLRPVPEDLPSQAQSDLQVPKGPQSRKRLELTEAVVAAVSEQYRASHRLGEHEFESKRPGRMSTAVTGHHELDPACHAGIARMWIEETRTGNRDDLGGLGEPTGV